MLIKSPQGPIRPIVEALMELELMAGLNRSLEASAADQLRKLRTEAEVVEIDGEYAYEIFHGVDGSTWSLESVFGEWFPSMQRAATFLIIWGWFERQLIELGREVKKEVNVAEGPERQGLAALRKFLLDQSVVGSWSSTEWQELPDFQRIRNLLAHNDGVLEDKHTLERAYAEKCPHLRIRDEIAIHVEATFVPYVLKRIEVFLKSMHGAVVQRFGLAA